MKLSLILLIAFCAIAFCGFPMKRAYQMQCSSYQCEKSGETCGEVTLQSSFISTGCVKAETEYCNITESGTNIKQGSCIPYATEGQSCSNVECGLGLACPRVLNPTCLRVPTLNITRLPGQTCGAANFECQYDYDTSDCVDGVCRFNADGASCTGDNQCKYTSTCSGYTFLSAGICQPRFAEGSNCNTTLRDDDDESSNLCADGLYCIPVSTTTTAGKCSPIFSVKEKGACVADSDCKEGVCTDAEGAADVVFHGVCADYKKTSTRNKPCANDDDCTRSNGERCICVDDDKSLCKTTDYERRFRKDIEKSDACEEKFASQCANLEERDQLRCYLKNCKKEYCKNYKNAKKEGLASYVYGDNTCAYVQVCAAAGLFASLPLVAIAVIFMLLQ